MNILKYENEYIKMNQYIDIFDGSNKIWKHSSENSQIVISDDSDKRIEKYMLIEKLINEDNFNSCSINVNHRLGSESTKGEVYKTSLKIEDESIEMATKILPILSDKSIEDNENEIRLALEASELILKGESIYFPIVYNFAICEETNFYNNKDYKLSFYERSLRYQQFHRISSSVLQVFEDLEIIDSNFESLKKLKDETLNKILEFKRSLKSPEFTLEYIIKKLENYDINTNIQKGINSLTETNLNIKISSHLLFSEIASYDLNYYLNNFKLSYDDLYDILYKIFNAINDLHTKLNILHNDLHLGNILILEIVNINEDDFSKSQLIEIPLIHDFGNSRKVNFEKIHKQDRIKDILYFMGQFRDRLKDLNYIDEMIEDLDIKKNTIRFNRFLDEIDDILLESKSIYPIQDVIEYIEKLNP